MKLQSSVVTVIGHKFFWISLFFGIVWANALIGTTDLKNWLIENTLTVFALLFLVFTYTKYRFSNTSYVLICVFLCLHVYGSKYTYAQNLFGYWLQELFHTSRNNYDRIVHFSFGALLYYPLKECLSNRLKTSKNLALSLPILIILSASALYEILEWLVADVFFVEQGLSYLGTQGDIWDSQKDMGLAFLGVVLVAVCFYLYSILKNRKKRQN
ncbi:DUF2238 domain-containing protein [Olleya namhaensis]|uniref:Putative membrane protein n=1 Tax=Olleya namhaensis TaxID=1144750 RepID=A0A1I3KXC4_9FLAO|nr:DUF2238 domain-containing protein [Olleya namhaensis]SFI76755.1 putative membrane protein [Olleya namhaensis]